MKDKNIKVDKFGENISAIYLKMNNYRIICRNYRKKFGEIDIIAINKSGLLVFFEVKTILSGNKDFHPEYNFTTYKYIKVKKMCEFFVRDNPQLINEELVED